MSIASALGRSVFLGGGLVGNVLGGALQGAGAAVGGIAKGAGSAVGGIAEGIGAAVGGALTPAPKVVVNNVGIVGSAAKSKVTGGGTLPAPKKATKTSVNANMPTEKLLVVAVNYLSSIDKTLQDQLKFESHAFAQQVQAEKESAIEEKKPSIFAKMSDKLGGLLKTKDDSTVKSRAGTLTKAILAASGIAAIGLLGLGNMDTPELDRLKNSWSEFSKKYDWLIDVADAVTGFGAGAGYLLGGFGGAVIGIVADWMVKRLTGNSLAGWLLKGLGLGGDATAEGTPEKKSNTGFDYAMGGVVAGYGAYRGVKTYRDVRGRITKMAEQRAAPRAAPSLKGSGFRDPKTGRAVSREAVTAGGGWLSGPKGQKFVAFLSKRFGKTYIAKKIMPLLARVFAGIAVTATGVGAIPGAIWTLVNIGLSLWTVYDLIDAWWDFQDEEEARGDAEAANKGAAKPDAEKVSGSPATPSLAADRVATKSETGKPEEAQAFFESKGWSKEQAAGIVGNLVVESGLKTDAVGDGGDAYGIAQWHPDRQAKFNRQFGKDIRQSSFQEQLEFVNWELNNDEKAAGNRLRNASSAEDAAAIVDQYYERSSGAARQQRINNASAIVQGDFKNLQGGGGSGGGGGGVAKNMAKGMLDITKEAMSAVADIVGAGVGPMSTRKTTDTLTAGAASMAPSKTATKVESNDKKAAEISKVSASIQQAVDLGSPKSEAPPKVQETSAQTSIRKASNDSKLECIDPNYPGTGGVEGYLQYYRLAA